MPVSNTTEAKDFIKGWMGHRKVFDTEIEPTPSDFHFQFNGKSEGGVAFTILQPKIWDTSVLVISEVIIGETHLKILETMRERERDEFIKNLANNIISAPAYFAFDPTYDKNGFPQGIQFSKEICYDNLSEDRLSNSMRDVVMCAIYVVELFKKEFFQVSP